MYGGNLGGDVVWLVGRGQRYDDSPHRDFHKQLGLKLQLDPTDSWKPTRKDDYPALFAKRAEEETQAALEAIREARDEAVEHPNTVVEIELPRLDSSVGEASAASHNSSPSRGRLGTPRSCVGSPVHRRVCQQPPRVTRWPPSDASRVTVHRAADRGESGQVTGTP